MGQPVPYRWISDLSPEAQRELERNFLALQVQIAGGNGFDATIDPAAANDSSKHTYKNLAGLIAGETGWTSTYLMTVRLVGRPGQEVIDTTTNALPGPLAITGVGMTDQYQDAVPLSPVSRSGHPVWNVQGQISGNFPVTLNDITIYNGAASGSITLFASGTTLAARNSHFVGSDANGANTRIASLGSNIVIAHDSDFYSLVPLGATSSFLRGVNFMWGLLTSLTFNGQHIWDGGIMGVYAGSTPTVTISGGNAYIRWTDYSSSDFGGTAGGSTTNSVINWSGGNGVLDYVSGSVFPILNVTNTAGQVRVRGTYHSATIVGGGANSLRDIDITHRGGVLDVTGPCILKAHVQSGVSTGHSVKLRGGGIEANIIINTGSTNPWLSAIALTDSVVVCTFAGGAPGYQAYTIDVASARNIFVFSGVNNGFSVASTNAGASCLVITEAGVAPTGAAGGSLSGTYPNPAIANDVSLPGSPTTTTQAPGDNSTKVATTAYADAIAALKANLASPTFTGDPKAPTPTAGDNDTSIATTAFVTAAIAAVSGLVYDDAIANMGLY